MFEGNRTPTRHFVESGVVHASVEPASDGEDNLQSQLLEKNLSPSEVDRRLNAIVTLLATQIEALVQSVKELSGSGSNRSSERNAAPERSRSSDLQPDNDYAKTLAMLEVVARIVLVS